MQHMQRHGAPEAQDFADPARNIKLFGIEHGMKVADFGAGTGAYTLEIAKTLSGSGKVYAIDIQKDLLRRIHSEAQKRALKNIEIIWADLEVRGSSKISDHTVDRAILSNLLFQLPNKSVALEEAKRVIKPNGRVILIDWSESFGGMGPHKNDVLSKTAAKALASSVGLRVEDEFSAGAHHYGLILSNAEVQ